MTSDERVLAALRLAIERVGVANLARRPGLARNVLGDLLPDDPLAVSLLSAAAEQGVVERLQDDADEDAAIIVPRLADVLASSRGLVPEQGRWAVDTWAAALGRQVPVQVPPPEPGPDAAGGSETATDTGVPARVAATVDADPRDTEPSPTGVPTRRAPEPRERKSASATRAAQRPPIAQHEPQAPRAPGASRVRHEPAPRSRRRRSRVVVLVLAAVVLLGALGLVFSLVLAPSKAEASAWSRTAVVQPKASGVVATVSHDMAEPLGSRPVRLRNGDQIEVTTGPVEIRLGASALRLDDGTTINYTAGTKTSVPLITMTKGQIWVTAAPGQRLALRSPSSEHADLKSGRFVAKCDNSCSYETLDEPQLVHTGGFAYEMQPHQRFVPSTASTESMDSQMNMTPASPTPTGSHDSGMSMSSTPDPNAPKPEFVAADILRSTPWVAANLKSDRREHRHYTAVNGRSLLGTWTVMLERPDVPADVHRVLTFSLSHCDTATCALSATTTYIDPGGTQRSIRGYAEVGDASGNQVKLTYDPEPVACRTVGRADGTQDLVDNLVFSGKASGSGTRVAKYTPGAGSSCTSAQNRDVPAATIAIVAHSDLTKQDAPFTSPGSTESLVLNHVHGATSTCSANKQRLDGESADATCTPPSATAGGPKTIAYYSFPNAAALNAAYSAQVAASNQRRNAGNCDQGACERPEAGGRRLIYGDAFLVEIDQRERMMIVASGSVRSQLARWRASQRDFSFSPFPVRGY